MIYTLSNIIAPRKRTYYKASPRRRSRIAFIRIQYGAGTPTYAYVDSLQVGHEELIWPYPEKQFPIELFSRREAIAENAKLQQLFPTPGVDIGSNVSLHIHNDAPEPLVVSVTFEWETSQD